MTKDEGARVAWPIPHPAEQRIVVTKVEPLMVLCDARAVGPATTENTRNSLLNALLRHHPPSAGREPATAG
ncbi:MAG: hypothetical protein OXN89_13115 [Bryobacterales bacterium]|nr:hypothetical protein [Bryobacterales bacterium]